MFICSENGHLFNVQLPFMETGGGTCTNFRFFNRAISKMCLTYDDNCLVTASVDGTLVIWSILNNENRRAALDERLGSCSDVLIPRKTLLDKIETVASLEGRIFQQSEEFSYQFQQKEIAHDNLVQGIHKSYSGAIEELKTRNRDLEKEHIEELNLITARNAEAEDAHQKQLLDLETEFHRKIITEYDKNKELSASFNKLRDESNSKLRKTAGYLEDTIESMESDFRQQIDNRRERIQQLVEYNESLKKEFVEYCQQERAQNERELVGLRMDYEKRMLHEQEVNSKWRNEAGVISKKFGQASKENNKLREDFSEVQEANAELQSVIEENGLEREEMKSELQRLFMQLQERDRTIQGLVRRVNELESVKASVEGQMTSLRLQLEPKDAEILKNAEDLRNLMNELEYLHKNKTELELAVTNTKQRNEGLLVEMKLRSVENHKTKTYLSRVIADVHLLNDFILQPEKLKKAVVKLFSK